MSFKVVKYFQTCVEFYIPVMCANQVFMRLSGLTQLHFQLSKALVNINNVNWVERQLLLIHHSMGTHFDTFSGSKKQRRSSRIL